MCRHGVRVFTNRRGSCSESLCALLWPCSDLLLESSGMCTCWARAEQVSPVSLASGRMGAEASASGVGDTTWAGARTLKKTHKFTLVVVAAVTTPCARTHLPASHRPRKENCSSKLFLRRNVIQHRQNKRAIFFFKSKTAGVFDWPQWQNANVFTWFLLAPTLKQSRASWKPLSRMRSPPRRLLWRLPRQPWSRCYPSAKTACRYWPTAEVDKCV